MTRPVRTPQDEACATGPAAGNTDTALREFLLKQGYTVFTSPAMAGRGQVVDQTGFGSFGVCPVTLPENMTVNSTGSIDTAGEHLARFLNWLHTEKGHHRGRFRRPFHGRAVPPAPPSGCSPPPTPGEGALADHHRHAVAGSYLSDFANGIVPLSDCLGDNFCESAMNTFKGRVLQLMAGSGREVNQAFLMGQNGWNQFQSGVLDKIPVVLIGGKKFTAPPGRRTRRCGERRPGGTAECAGQDIGDRCWRTGAASPSTTPTASSSRTPPAWTGKPP